VIKRKLETRPLCIWIRHAWKLKQYVVIDYEIGSIDGPRECAKQYECQNCGRIRFVEVGVEL